MSVVNLLVLQRHDSQLPPPPRLPPRLDFPEAGAGRPARARPQPPRHEWRYACRVCRKPFRTPALVARHMRTHTGERPYACAECGFTFKEMSHLRVHARKHALGGGGGAGGGGLAPRRCDACGGVFRREEHFKQHRCCGRALAALHGR
ncbi:hypothetical protein R5R35_008763 [Gryllus longicercus]|uniref:C2H2-type domain-containing protein n=1 Tax=Gryllus longicercus TaxID=2509291 RepID=A0AAN9VNT2_9ORTH